MSCRLPGTFYLIVETDAVKAIVESDEDNTRPVQIELVNPPLSDLIVQNITATGLPTPGLPLTLNWQVVHNGAEAAAGSWVERVYLADSPSGENRQLLASFNYNGLIAPQDSPASSSQSITLPLTSFNGTVYFAVEVDATNNIAESDESNLFVSAASYAVPAPLAVSFPASQATEGGAPLQGTVTRNGDPAQPLVVTLTSSVADQIAKPATVTIPAGQYSHRFDVSALVDNIADDNIATLVTAAAGRFLTVSRCWYRSPPRLVLSGRCRPAC